MIRLRLGDALLLALLATLALPRSLRADDDRTAELERKVDALSRQVEALQMGGAPDTARATSRTGLAPGASRIYEAARGTSVGGYGEMLFTHPDRTRQDDALSGGVSELDLLRAVVYVGHKFTDDLLFNSELEWEHGGVLDEAEVEVDPGTGLGESELSGEATVEFAYLDWRIRPWLGIRGGKLLVPMGLVNEMHEPPVFFGARRPDVERVIVPSTWTAKGIGVYGEAAAGLRWRAYLVDGLDASGFHADNAIREGRQSGVAVTTHPGVTGRLDWEGVPGLLVGVAGYTCDARQGLQGPGPRESARTTLVQAHARWSGRGLEARGLWVRGAIDHAGALSDASGFTGTERLGDRFHGASLELAYDVLALLDPSTRFGLVPYARFEELDPQEGGLAPGEDDPALHERVLTVGAAFRPHPEVVVKLDRQQRRNDARTAISSWNAALGWLF